MLAVHLPHPQNVRPHIKDCAGQLATISRGSLFTDKVAGTCILQVSKADVTLPTPNNQPRSVAFLVLHPQALLFPPPKQVI